MKSTLLFLLLAVLTVTSAIAQQYMVQLAVYDRPVEDNHFGVTDARIYHSEDKYGFHRYFVGTYGFAEAEAASKRFREAGYRAVEIVGEGEFDSRCSCFLTDRPVETRSSVRLRSIFFDFDSSELTGESRARLDRLVRRLRENPSYTVGLYAHTDAKGSDAYNEALSQRRAQAARRYLLDQGIADARIEENTFGKRAPIARNTYASGQDAARGRQLNRRVELTVRDGNGNALNLVEAIAVPADLQQ